MCFFSDAPDEVTTYSAAPCTSRKIKTKKKVMY